MDHMLMHSTSKHSPSNSVSTLYSDISLFQVVSKEMQVIEHKKAHTMFPATVNSHNLFKTSVCNTEEFFQKLY